MTHNSDHVNIGISLVVAAIDDFNNKPINGSRLRVWIDGEKPAIVKTEGYYVFVNLKHDDFILHLEGGFYNRQDIKIDREDLESYRGRPMIIRMMPNHSYPVPSDTTCVEGNAPKESVVSIYSMESSNPYKLLYAYEKGSSDVYIFHPDEINIEGKTLIISDKEKKKQEFVHILEKCVEDDENEKQSLYRISPPLKNSYKKIGTVLYPVYSVEAGAKGYFYLPIPDVNGEKADFIFNAGDEEKVFTLYAGKINKIDIK